MDVDEDETIHGTRQLDSQKYQAEDKTRKIKYAVVDGYEIAECIGSGGFSRVFRAYNHTTGRVRACKVVDVTPPNPGSSSSASPAVDAVDLKILQKEVKVHKMLTGPSDEESRRNRPRDWSRYILAFYNAKLVKDPGVVGGLYMLMELAMGGDLFDKIEPDQGVDPEVAKFYFAQILSGLEFMHSKGICHRDMKPENLLLSATGDIKITDFGLCAVYKHQGETRQLSGRCGSLPYVAPELDGNAPYDAEPVDIWGAGVVLFTLLVGNTPWDEPSQNSPEFQYYTHLNPQTERPYLLEHSPWNMIDPTALDLLLGLLEVDPKRRCRIEDAKQHIWLMTPSQISRAGLAKALTQGLHRSGAMRFIEPEVHTLPLSQRPRVPTQTQTQTQMSQIATQFMADVGMTSTSTQGDGGVVVNPSMTRFKLKLSPDETIEIMGQVLGYLVDVKGVAENGEPQMHVLGTETGYRVSLLDTRRQPLRGEIIIGWDDKYADVSKVIVERSKGDHLEWKRFWWDIVKLGQLRQHLLKTDEE